VDTFIKTTRYETWVDVPCSNKRKKESREVRHYKRERITKSGEVLSSENIVQRDLYITHITLCGRR